MTECQFVTVRSLVKSANRRLGACSVAVFGLLSDEESEICTAVVQVVTTPGQ
jgi:hypothetical protein